MTKNNPQEIAQLELLKSIDASLKKLLAPPKTYEIKDDWEYKYWDWYFEQERKLMG